MKAANLALAVIFALNGVALANEVVERPAKSDVEKARLEKVVDPTPTGSIGTAGQAKPKKPRIGMDLNPFSFGTFH